MTENAFKTSDPRAIWAVNQIVAQDSPDAIDDLVDDLTDDLTSSADPTQGPVPAPVHRGRIAGHRVALATRRRSR